MVARAAASLTLAAALILWTAWRSPRPAQAQAAAPQPSADTARAAPRASFSPWYVEALGGVLKLEEADVARLEQQLAQHPTDFSARLKLMAYHLRADRDGHPEDAAKRLDHTFWLIEHHPESELLHSYVSRFQPGELDEAQYQRAVTAWDAAAKANPGDAAILWNAASFFEPQDPDLYLSFLEATAATDPNHPKALRPLSHLYALSMLERGPLAARAQAGLEASKNVWVLGNTANMFQSQYNQSRQRGAPNRRAAELAERYFLRAKALDPNLDRNAILPQIDMQEVAKTWRAQESSQREWAARAAKAVVNIRRLAVEAFPELPAPVAGVLRARHCRVPQPEAGDARRNVIRGEFFAKGELGWAVLCSLNNSTSLLAFRNDSDSNPDTVTTTEDRVYVQLHDGGEALYARQIAPVNHEFILNHYRAHGGPEPPPIDHHGIDDAFLEKASITWYFHDGEWLQLQGAD
jgi:hypothetical protein